MSYRNFGWLRTTRVTSEVLFKWRVICSMNRITIIMHLFLQLVVTLFCGCILQKRKSRGEFLFGIKACRLKSCWSNLTCRYLTRVISMMKLLLFYSWSFSIITPVLWSAIREWKTMHYDLTEKIPPSSLSSGKSYNGLQLKYIRYI